MQFFNTRTNRKEEFTPLVPKKVLLYVCGITPYDTTHLGHAFTYIWFDVLVRYLEFKDFKVTYTQNVTDINDRNTDILKRAQEQNVSWDKLAEFWTERFLTDMKALNFRRPDFYLKASEHIPTMIKLIQQLLEKDYAYEKSGNIFLDITKIKEYGSFSRLNTEEMLKIAQVFEEDLENPLKRNKLDVTLWRAKEPNQPPHIPAFDSPFGEGRPGWHIECSAMTICSLGEQIDIHGGGEDLIFPHHEAEIAQSESATGKKPFVNFWLHSATVSYKGSKMSKSLGNLVLIADLLKTYTPNAIRYLLLLNHYKTPWEFKENDLKKAQTEVQYIEEFLSIKNSIPELDITILTLFKKYMDDNLLANEYVQWVYQNISKFSKNELSTIKATFYTLGFTF